MESNPQVATALSSNSITVFADDGYFPWFGAMAVQLGFGAIHTRLTASNSEPRSRATEHTPHPKIAYCKH